jgi:flagellar hook-associated protein 3 FlgL
MITRVSTAGNYNIVLANLANAQSQQIIAGNQVATQKVATDLKGYGNQAETLTAMQTTKAQIDGLVSQNAILDDRYTDQDTALTQIGGAATSASTAISDALASGNSDALMQAMQSAFSDAVSGLNMQSQGTYLFSGGQVNTQPVTATSMSDLTTPAATSDINSIFKNDNYVASNQISQNSSVQGGMLASNLGSGLMQAFQDIQTFQNGPDGPFSGTLTDAQTSFLQTELGKFNTQQTNLTTATAQNGEVQKEIETAGTSLTNQQSGLEGMIGNITSVNMADAVSRLQNAQTAVQASAQVFTALQSSSLLNYLPISS